MKLNPKFNGRYVQGGGGTKLFVEETGDASKPTILWLHGYCQSRLSWDRQFENEALASQFHMVRLDLRGHGLSDKLTDPQAFRDSKNWADDIHAVITAFSLKKPVLVGWSYGGYIICDYIRHYGQDNLGGIIFVAATTEMGRDEANAMLGAEFLQLGRGFFSTDYVVGSTALQNLISILTYKELDPHTFYFFLGFNSVTLPASRKGMFTRRLDNRDLMKTITLPSLIVQGKNDRVVLPVYADFIARHLPHSSRADYDNCGHLPFVEAADRFNQDVTAFMQTVQS
jgi:pimeloyl-ACP methyl ester carboxylesterase